MCVSPYPSTIPPSCLRRLAAVLRSSNRGTSPCPYFPLPFPPWSRQLVAPGPPKVFSDSLFFWQEPLAPYLSPAASFPKRKCRGIESYPNPTPAPACDRPAPAVAVGSPALEPPPPTEPPQGTDGPTPPSRCSQLRRPCDALPAFRPPDISLAVSIDRSLYGWSAARFCDHRSIHRSIDSKHRVGWLASVRAFKIS